MNVPQRCDHSINRSRSPCYTIPYNNTHITMQYSNSIASSIYNSKQITTILVLYVLITFTCTEATRGLQCRLFNLRYEIRRNITTTPLDPPNRITSYNVSSHHSGDHTSRNSNGIWPSFFVSVIVMHSSMSTNICRLLSSKSVTYFTSQHTMGIP
jgi:hypothetical protein